MRTRILNNWTLMRAFYTGIGLVVATSSALQREWAGVALGAYFLSMGVFAYGCAAPGGCAVSVPRGSKRVAARAEPEYEEIL